MAACSDRFRQRDLREFIIGLGGRRPGLGRRAVRPRARGASSCFSRSSAAWTSAVSAKTMPSWSSASCWAMASWARSVCTSLPAKMRLPQASLPGSQAVPGLPRVRSRGRRSPVARDSPARTADSPGWRQRMRFSVRSSSRSSSCPCFDPVARTAQRLDHAARRLRAQFDVFRSTFNDARRVDASWRSVRRQRAVVAVKVHDRWSTTAIEPATSAKHNERQRT